MIFETGPGEIRASSPSSKQAAAVREAARSARRAVADVVERLEESKRSFLAGLRGRFEEAGVYRADLSFGVSEHGGSLNWTYSLPVGDWELKCLREEGLEYAHWDESTHKTVSQSWKPFGSEPLAGSACLWCQAGQCRMALHNRPGALGEHVRALAAEIDREAEGPVKDLFERLEAEVFAHERTDRFLEARRAFATDAMRKAIRLLGPVCALADRDSVVEAVDLVVAERVLES